eukprot:43095_1
MLQLFVQSHSFHGTTVINIHKNQTIADVKLRIEDRRGIPATQQRLTRFGACGITLSDHLSLAYYQLQNEHTLLLQIKPPQNTKSAPRNTQMRNVFLGVEQLNGKITDIIANETDTIGTIKAEIKSMYGIPIDHQCLLLNGTELNNKSTVTQNGITSQTVLKMELSSYHRYKLVQNSITNNINPESANISATLSQSVLNLNTILSQARDCIWDVDSLSSLSPITQTYFERIASELNSVGTELDSLRQLTNEAKRRINDNHQKVVSSFMQERNNFMETMHHLDDEIADLNKQIEGLLLKRNDLKRVKQEKYSFFEGHYDVYANAYQSIRNQNFTDLDTKLSSIESVCAALHSTEYETQLKELVNEKLVLFETQYEGWSVLDTMEWIKTIENEYFKDKRFEPFINLLKDIEINGQMLTEINNNLFLKTAGGLKQEKDRRILRKHINRIVKHASDVYSHNICGLCIENAINTVNLPCGHCYTCYECSQKQPIRKCQICRKDVLQIVQTFMNGFSK